MKVNKNHHGNLREELIKAGIKIINEEGVENLSLRKAAVICGVSHSAPKSHFNNKEEYIEAIKKFVTEKFTKAIKDVVNNNKDRNEMLMEFGMAYILFFKNNPEYFRFILNEKDVTVHVTNDRVIESSYEPFQIFHENASSILKEWGWKEEEITKTIIYLWSLVYGLSALTISESFKFEGDWMEMIKNIISKAL